MPIVDIRFDPKRFTNQQIEKLRAHLPAIVAEALSDTTQKETQLKASQIGLEFNEKHRFDVNDRPIRMLVFCEGFPVRLENSDGRAASIAEAARLLDHDFCLEKDLGWVWIYPGVRTGFAEIGTLTET